MTAMRPRTNSRGDRSTPWEKGGNDGSGGGMGRPAGAYSITEKMPGRSVDRHLRKSDALRLSSCGQEIGRRVFYIFFLIYFPPPNY